MINFFRKLRAKLNHSRIPPVASQWESMLLSTSEELWDEHDLGVTIPLAEGVSYDAIVRRILTEARHKPDLRKLISKLRRQFGLSYSSALTAIDRTLGGVVRASTALPDDCPDPATDPIAWHSFQQTSADIAIVKEIYGDCDLSGPR